MWVELNKIHDSQLKCSCQWHDDCSSSLHAVDFEKSHSSISNSATIFRHCSGWSCFSSFTWPCFISIYCIFNAMYLMFSIYWKQCVVGTSSNHSLIHNANMHHARTGQISCSLWFPLALHTHRNGRDREHETLENWNGTWCRLQMEMKRVKYFSINYLCCGMATVQRIWMTYFKCIENKTPHMRIYVHESSKMSTIAKE